MECMGGWIGGLLPSMYEELEVWVSLLLPEQINARVLTELKLGQMYFLTGVLLPSWLEILQWLI